MQNDAMHEVTQSLIELLRVVPQPSPDERTDLYQGSSEDLGFRNLFGGQILGQSLNAAVQSAPDGFFPHSLHAYFLLPGSVKMPVDYKVEVLRTGSSFAALRVDAMQDGKIILTQNCSFQRAEAGFEHQAPMPEVKGPDGVLSQLELTRMFKDMFPEHLREIYTREKPLEMRPLDPINIFQPDKRSPEKYVWFKPINDWPKEEAALHYALLAYSSDFNLVTTGLQPHGVSVATKGMQLASLDHSIWFHRTPRLDDWLLYSIQSPAAAGGRGLNFGHIYHRDGQLMMSVAQEGLMRLKEPSAQS